MLVAECQSKRIPVFKVDQDVPIKDKTIASILSRAHSIPLITEKELGRPVAYQDEIEHQQQEVDFIAGIIGKRKSEINLAFGGIYAEACVHLYAAGWCRKVETNHRPFSPFKLCHDPIAKARVLDEIT